MRQDAHAAVVQRVENRVGKTVASKGRPDIVLSQEVNGASPDKTSEPRRTYPVCFALIYEGDGVGLQLKRIGNRCGFPVVKCLRNGAGDEAGKMLHPSAAKLHDLQLSRRLPCVDRGSVVPAGLPAAFEFQNDL